METGCTFVTQAPLNKLNLKIVVSWDMTPCSLAYTIVTNISDIFLASIFNVEVSVVRGIWCRSAGKVVWWSSISLKAKVSTLQWRQ
jgi:hypothetical protein